MQTISTRIKGRCALSEELLLRLLVFVTVTGQLISVLRGAGIYNTSIISNWMGLALKLLYCLYFLAESTGKAQKLDSWDLFYFGIPILAMAYGLLFNPLGREYFSDIFNALTFAVVVNHYRQTPEAVNRKNLEYIANVQTWGAGVSLFIYYLFEPVLGIQIQSVGKMSVFPIYCLSYFLAYGSSKWIVVLAVILLGGKRGVLLAAVAVVLLFYLTDKRRGGRTLAVIAAAAVFAAALIFFTSSPERVNLLPSALRGMAGRFMKVNPFSAYMDIHSDGRMDEIEGALGAFKDDPWTLLIGKGNGFTYTEIYKGYVFENHNVHFTPVCFLTRYGAFYTLAFYMNAVWTLSRGIRYIRRNREHAFIMCLMLSAFGGLVFSFTAFSPYVDFQYMLSLGMLNGLLKRGVTVDHEGIQRESGLQPAA